MSASNEWTEGHLTLRGSEQGTEKEDFRTVNREPPSDRIKTVRWHDYLSSIYSTPDRYHSETWTSDYDAEIGHLLSKFGGPPSHL